jgi:hypothetical protein
MADLTFAAMLQLANAARAEVDAERGKLATAFTTMAEEAGLTVVRTDPFEEAVVHPDTLGVLRRMVKPEIGHRPWGGQVGRLINVPVIADTTVPPGEIHLRPSVRQEPRP